MNETIKDSICEMRAHPTKNCCHNADCDGFESCEACWEDYRSNLPSCWWCKEYGTVPLRVFTIHGCQSITVKYCPLCGRKLEDTNGV